MTLDEEPRQDKVRDTSHQHHSADDVGGVGRSQAEQQVRHEAAREPDGHDRRREAAEQAGGEDKHRFAHRFANHRPLPRAQGDADPELI